MIGKDISVLPFGLYNTYEKQLDFVKQWENSQPGVEMIRVQYSEVLKNTTQVVSNIEKFVGRELDKHAMSSCVDPSLYRNRVHSV